MVVRASQWEILADFCRFQCLCEGEREIKRRKQDIAVRLNFFFFQKCVSPEQTDNVAHSREQH